MKKNNRKSIKSVSNPWYLKLPIVMALLVLIITAIYVVSVTSVPQQEAETYYLSTPKISAE